MTVLLYGDTIRYPALRHEVPLAILDPFLFADHEGRALILTSSLETSRIATALPEAELLTFDELGLYELVADGVPRDQAELDTLVAALERWRIDAAVVAPDLPVAVADRLRAGGVALTVDGGAIQARRRRQVAGGARGHPPRPARSRGGHCGRREAHPRR